MELIAILLSGITSLFSLTGVVVDRNIEAALLSRVDRAEQLQVRADNAPPHQILGGQINKVRIASRGLWVNRNLRIETFDVETDPLAVNLKQLEADGQNPRAASLQKPIQAGVRLKFNEADLNNYLKSPEAIEQLRKMTTSTFGSVGNSLNKDYQIANPEVKFLGNNRVALKADLQDPNSGEKLRIDLETGISVKGGRTVQLTDPAATVGNTPVPAFILSGLTEQLGARFSLEFLEQRGITARILQLKVNPQELDVAAFVKVSGRDR